jgi:hypothetical protein
VARLSATQWAAWPGRDWTPSTNDPPGVLCDLDATGAPGVTKVATVVVVRAVVRWKK